MAIPGSDIYGWRKNEALNAWNAAKLSIGKRRQNVLQTYGYVADYDDKGNVTGMRVDPTSTSGRFQSMMRGHSQQLDMADEDRVSRGLGQSGLGAQRETATRYDQSNEQAQFGQALSGEVSELAEALGTAETGYNSEIARIDIEAARQAWEDQQFTKAMTPEDEQDSDEIMAAYNAPGKNAPAPARVASLVRKMVGQTKPKPKALPKPKPKPKPKRRK